MLILLTHTLAPQLLCPSVGPLAMTAFAGHCRTWPLSMCSMAKRFAVQHRQNVALPHVDSWCAGAGSWVLAVNALKLYIAHQFATPCCSKESCG